MLSVLLIALFVPLFVRAGDSSLETRSDRFLDATEQIVRANPPEASRLLLSSAYRAAVAGYQAGGSLASVSDRDLHDLQLTAEVALYYGLDGEVEADAKTFFEEALHRTDIANAARIYHRSLLLSGSWAEAEAIEPLLAGQAPVTRVEDRTGLNSGRVVLVADGPNRFVATERLPLQNGVYIIGHEGCSWTRQAMAALTTDDRTREFVSNNAMWISPASTVLQDVRSKGSPYVVVQRAADWPEITHWDLPSFAFMRDGQVVEQFTGWPGPESIDRFLAGMAKVDPVPERAEHVRKDQ